MPKPPKSIEEQIQLLKSRNMTFENTEKAKNFLSYISYYRLQGYWWEMQEDKVNHYFKNNSSFEKVIQLYDFDRQFRILIFNAIERIEIALRTKLIYHLSIRYGALWYDDIKIINKIERHKVILEKINSDLKNCTEEFIIKHYENHPNEKPESWKTLEILSFTTLSKIYSNLNHQLPEKNIIAKEFGFNNQKYLASYLQTISFIRNIVAHHSRLWNRAMINKSKWDLSTTRKILNFVPNNKQQNKIFPILSTILYMINNVSTDYQTKKEFVELFKNNPNIDLHKMGFPENWKKQPIWKEI